MDSKTKLSRRRFLKDSVKLSLAGTFGSLVKVSEGVTRTISSSAQYDCLILGAGVAGLTAARRLYEASHLRGKPLKILIVEGSGRLGGRVFTSHGLVSNAQGKGVPLELGAEYVHRRPNSVPLWHDLYSLKARIQELPKVKNSYMYHSGFPGTKLKKIFSLFGDSAVGDWGISTASKLYSLIDKYNGRDLSAADWIVKHYVNNQKVFGQDMASLALTGDLAAEDHDLSIHGFRSDLMGELSGDSSEYSLVDGYDFLLNGLGKGIEIINQSRVTRIDYSKDKGVTVYLRSGGTLRAKTTICTFSTGMLRSGEVEFTPDLPAHKKAALETIRSGHVSKFVIEFSERFWPEETTYLLCPDSNRKGARTYFNMTTVHGDKPAVLIALATGSDALRLQNYSDREITEMICADLDLMFPQKKSKAMDLISFRDLGKTQMILRKQWDDDPYAKGGGSYLTVAENTLTARRDLAEPNSTAPLFWAGEATALVTQPSTVHGAHESGIRAAQEVFNYLFYRDGRTLGPKIYGLEESRKDYKTWHEIANQSNGNNVDLDERIPSGWEDLFGWRI